jgi:membrane protein DedA with SNARE-associated domain
MSQNNHRNAFYIFNLITQFFLETFVSMALGYFLGQWLDGMFFEDKVILTYIFVVLGIFAGLRNLIVRALKYEKGEDDEK